MRRTTLGSRESRTRLKPGHANSSTTAKDDHVARSRSRSPGRTHQPATSTASRSEEHTSELQSRLHLVCRLLLEKKKNRQLTSNRTKQTYWQSDAHRNESL